MRKKYTKKDLIQMTSKVDFGPSEAFVEEMKEEYEKQGSHLPAAKEGTGHMKLWVAGAAMVLCALLVFGTVQVLKGENHKAYADTYSFEEYVFNAETNADMSDTLVSNFAKSNQMVDNFISNTAAGTSRIYYAIDSVSAAGFPEYYAGRYINVDGKLIVLIKENFFRKDFRKCDWYKELVKMLGSEDFSCRPVEYSYSELLIGLEEAAKGSLYQKLLDAGIRASEDDTTCEILGFGINECENRIHVEIRRESDRERIMEILSGGMYVPEIVGEVAQIWDFVQ